MKLALKPRRFVFVASSLGAFLLALVFLAEAWMQSGVGGTKGWIRGFAGDHHFEERSSKDEKVAPPPIENQTASKGGVEVPSEESQPPEDDPCDPKRDSVGLEALYDTVRSQTVFMILASRKSDPQLVLSTWGKYVDRSRIIFVGSCAGCTFDVDFRTFDNKTLRDNWESLWVKTRNSFLATAERYPEANYIMKLDMDTYIVPENLYRVMISTMLPPRREKSACPSKPSSFSYVFPSTSSSPPAQPFYIGGGIHQLGRFYASGGGGYVLTRSALRATENLSKTVDCRELKKNEFFEDVYIGDCMRATGVPFVSSPAFLGYVWYIGYPSDMMPATLHGYKTRELYETAHKTIREEGYVLTGAHAHEATEVVKVSSDYSAPSVKKQVRIFNVQRGWEGY